MKINLKYVVRAGIAVIGFFIPQIGNLNEPFINFAIVPADLKCYKL
jgi:hypothetical protein